jgi:hypothetical protein
MKTLFAKLTAGVQSLGLPRFYAHFNCLSNNNGKEGITLQIRWLVHILRHIWEFQRWKLNVIEVL